MQYNVSVILVLGFCPLVTRTSGGLRLKLSRSSRRSRPLMYLSTIFLSDFFETKPLEVEQNILFQLACDVYSLRRAKVQNKS